MHATAAIVIVASCERMRTKTYSHLKQTDVFGSTTQQQNVWSLFPASTDSFTELGVRCVAAANIVERPISLGALHGTQEDAAWRQQRSVRTCVERFHTEADATLNASKTTEFFDQRGCEVHCWYCGEEGLLGWPPKRHAAMAGGHCLRY